MRLYIAGFRPLASPALAALTLATLTLGACALDNDLESGKYRCNATSDCLWGWTCAPNPGGVKTCVNLGGGADGFIKSDGAAASDGAVASDSRAFADGDATRSDSVVPPNKDGGGDDGDLGGPTSCTPNIPQCSDIGHFRRCNKQGTGYLGSEACPAQQRCEKGVCLSATFVTAYVSATVQIAYDTFTRKLRTVGGLSASFEYNSKKPAPTPQMPAVGTCAYQVLGSSSGTTSVKFDAGPITVTGIPSGTRTLRYNKASQRYEASPPLPVSQYPWGATLTFSSGGGGLVQGPWSAIVKAPTRREITAPSYSASHSKGAPLPIAWSGATNSGTVYIDMIDANAVGGGVWMRCNVNDTGSFTVPATYLSRFAANQPATIIVFEYTATPFSAKGLESGLASAGLLSQSSVVMSQ